MGIVGFVMGVFSIKVSVCGKDNGTVAIARGQTHTPFYYGSHADA